MSKYYVCLLQPLTLIVSMDWRFEVILISAGCVYYIYTSQKLSSRYLLTIQFKKRVFFWAQQCCTEVNCFTFANHHINLIVWPRTNNVMYKKKMPIGLKNQKKCCFPQRNSKEQGFSKWGNLSFPQNILSSTSFFFHCIDSLCLLSSYEDCT